MAVLLQGSSQERFLLSEVIGLFLYGAGKQPPKSHSKRFSDPTNLEICNCNVSKPACNIIDLIGDSQDTSSVAGQPAGGYWLHNALYTLTSVTREEVLSPSGWLSDRVISAVQLLIQPEFPHLSGLQYPMLQKNMSLSAQTNLCRSTLETVTGVLFLILDVMEWSMYLTTCIPLFPVPCDCQPCV